MNVNEGGKCAWTPDGKGRCGKPTDARFVLILHAGADKLEALLPFGACGEHAQIVQNLVQEGSDALAALPGVLHALRAFGERFRRNPDAATIGIVGVDTEELREYLKLAKASGANGAGVPILVEHARADDVKADMGERAFERTFGKG